jgi:protein-S-isoprenylcysteine O-methyltransferase Ste14
MLNLVARYALVFVVGAVILLAATGSLFSSSAAATVAQLLALGLAGWARRSFPTGTFRVGAAPAADTVIQRGPYRLIRHPMYAAALLFVWAAILSHRSLWTLSLGGVVTCVAAIRVMSEERLLRERYADYKAYARATKLLVPFVL